MRYYSFRLHNINLNNKMDFPYANITKFIVILLIILLYYLQTSTYNNSILLDLIFIYKNSYLNDQNL